MVTIGYGLSSEELGPRELVRYAARAEEVGFRQAWVSDHFHPWISEQGQSPFVWGVLGGIASATERLRIGTSVTCPTTRIHPAIIAQASATAAVLLEGRFFLGVGSGENLNEHILGDPWPPAPLRLEMLEEAIQVIRSLWSGASVSHYGTYYVVDDARLFTRPDERPPIYVSAFGRKAMEVAARVGDGYIGTSPSAELVRMFEDKAGAGKPKLGGPKVCWAEDAAEARRTVHRLWPNMGLPGQLSQDLRTVAHFEQAVQLVTEEMVAQSIPCGPDPQPYVDSLRQYADAGYDELYVQQIGPDQEGFFRFWERELRPALEPVLSG